MKRKISKLLPIFLILFSTMSYGAENIIMEISTLESLKEVDHSSNTGGKILEIYVKNGDYVEKDQVILKLKNKQIVSNYEASKSKYETAKLNYEKTKEFAKDQEILKLEKAEKAVITAEMTLQKAKNGTKEEELDRLRLSVETAKVNYETVKKYYEKNEILYGKGSISEQNFLQIKSNFEAAQNGYEASKKALILAEKGADIEDIKTLEASLKEAKANYTLIQKEVEKEIWNYDINLAKENMEAAKSVYEFASENYECLEVKAETSGIIANLNWDERNKVKEGEKLFTILNTDEMTLKIGIDEKYILGVVKEAEVEVYIPATNKTYTGVVDNINPMAKEDSKKFEAEIKIANKDHILKQGLHGEVTIHVN